jgi:hypothetical protein
MLEPGMPSNPQSRLSMTVCRPVMMRWTGEIRPNSGAPMRSGGQGAPCFVPDWETENEIRIGERQDAQAAIVLCPVL